MHFKRFTAVNVLLLQILFYTSCDSAKILALVPTPSYSHQNAFYSLWTELSLRGHQVTLITTDPLNNSLLTNLTEIDTHNMAYGIWNRILAGYFESGSGSIPAMLNIVNKAQLEIMDQTLSHPKIQNLIQNKTEHFDLFMVEATPTTDAYYAFAERFKCPFILISSYDGVTKYYRQIGNPSHPILNPDMFLPYNQVLTFKDRLLSVSLLLSINAYSFFLNTSTALRVEKYFGTGYPDMEKYGEKVSMFFINSNPILFRARPLYPNVIQFGGGIHIKPAQPLPKNLKSFLDSANEGCVYFSLGSNVKSKDLSPELKKIFTDTFLELMPYKILWKFENDKLENLPSNVMIYKWIPQQDVLRHSNIKLFITQGGLQSLEEALHNQVPVIGLPYFGDQPANVKQAVDKGMGLSIDPFTMTKENLKNTILEVLSNPKYQQRVKQLSELVYDKPISGLESIIWWTEYVIRHKGAKHFRSPALDIPFYQYYLLDVITFYTAVVITIIYIIMNISRLIHKLLRFILFKTLKDKVE